MAGLPHYTSSKASVNKFEPVFLNQFEVIITPPAAVVPPQGNPGNGNILLEQVKSVSGLQVDQTQEKSHSNSNLLKDIMQDLLRLTPD